MRHSKTLTCLLTWLIIISSSLVSAQKYEPKKRIIDPDVILSSKIMGKDYHLYISFPSGYSANDTIKYPVLYILDGLSAFPLFNSARTLLDFGNQLEKIIIVGIGSGVDFPSWYINRNYDYTPSEDTISDRQQENQLGFPKGTLHSGGGAKFLECLKTEIIPFVDLHYHVKNDRGLLGHSLGGLFTSYCLLNSKGIFNTYGITSPSLYWNDAEILKQAASLFRNKKWNTSSTKVFISVGGLEDATMIKQALQFSTSLEAIGNKNIDITSKIFDNETHLSVKPASLTRSISVLYGKK